MIIDLLCFELLEVYPVLVRFESASSGILGRTRSHEMIQHRVRLRDRIEQK